MRHQAVRFRRPNNEEPDINLIPLIDVLLVVLIFLVVSTTYTKYSQLKVVVPSAQGENSTEMKRNEILVSISSSGQYAVAGGTMETRELNSLTQALKDEVVKPQ
jgi:biopolymer transport protein ExbD